MTKQNDMILSKAQWCILLTGSALVLRLLIGTAYYNTFDLSVFNIPWAIGMGEHLFSAYQMMDNLDYPPLFPTLLWFVSGPVAAATEQNIQYLQMFWIKLVPILFDCALVVYLFFLGCRKSLSMGILLATVWAFNVAIIINSSFWGQTDSMLLLFILLMVVAFQDEKPTLAAIFFALGCLTKLQFAYFAPLLLIELFWRYRLPKACKALGIGLAVGIAGWLPYMIGSGSITLPFEIYFGGYQSYQYVNLNSANLYGMLPLNFAPSNLALIGGNYDSMVGWKLGGFTMDHLSTIFTVILLLVVGWSYWQSWRKSIRIPFTLNALFLLNGIFMITTKMHERYQMPAVLLTLLCFIVYQKKQYFWAFLAVTALSFFNQAFVLFQYSLGSTIQQAFVIAMPILSTLNIALWIWLLILYFKEHQGVEESYKRMKKQQKKQTSGI